MFKIKNKFLKKIGAGFMAGLCAFSMLGSTVGGVISASATNESTTENSAFPTSDKVVAKAASLLGSPYKYGNKGYWYAYNEGQYQALSVETINKLGIDCSGLVYYTLTQLGYKTSGFSWNNPVPVDTAHWESVNENCTISYDGVTSKIDVEKKDIPTKDRPYWQCSDGSTIAPGSVVVADNTKDIDHAWIYMGEFDSRNDVVSYLKSIGVASSLINSRTVGDGKGDGGKHWRIESNGDEGVVINNRTDGKKATALNMSAFRITKTDVEFEIDKFDTDGNLVGRSTVDNSSAIYGIYNDKTCKNKVGEIKIGSDGKGKIKLPNGKYFAKEIKAPTGYELDEKVHEIKSGKNKVTEDFKTGKIQINKTAEDGILGDREFKISYKLGGKDKSQTAKTNEKGIAVFDKLRVYDMSNGKAVSYNISEINVDEKYEIPKAKNVKLTDGNGDFTVVSDFDNRLKKFTVEVKKVDSEKKNPQGEATLSGAVYGLFKDGVLVDKYTTDDNGFFKTKEYICGDYSLQEIEPSKGYLLDKNVYKVGAEANNYKLENNAISMTVKEQVIKGNISIIKHSDNGETQIETPETGAEFEVYLKSAGSFENSKEEEKDVLVCDENGYAKSKDLPFGTYIVHQTKGWENTEFMGDFEVNISENRKDYFYILNDSVKKSFVKVVKKDAETGKVIPVSGIGFKVWDCANNCYVQQKINYPTEMTLDEFYTDENGSLMLPGELVYGDYELHEIKAAEGYVLDKEPLKFTVDGEEKTIEIEKFNKAQKGRISVQKTGDIFASVGVASSAFEDENGTQINPKTYTPIFTEKGLENAVFKVFAAEDIVTPDGTVRAGKGIEVAEITTDKNGFAQTDLLYLGKYEIKEVSAPDGHVLNAESQFAELTYAGQEIEVRDTVNADFFNDYQRVKISLSKAMEDDEKFGISHKEAMKNVRFGLFADEDLTAEDDSVIPANSLISEVNLEEDMTASFDEKIPFGKYYVQEISTDEHYILNGEKYLVNFEYMGQDTATVNVDCGQFVNKIKRGKIVGKKVDDKTEPLENATFGLFSKSCENFKEIDAIMTSTSDRDGNFGFDNVPFGEYIVCEIKAPTGYILSDEKYPVTISEDGEIIEITAENKPIAVEISKQDIHGKELSGAKMQLIDSEKNVVDEWTSDGKNHVVSKLAIGKYILKEVAAPDGYVIATDIEFEVFEDGSVSICGKKISATSKDGNPLIIMVDEAENIPEIPDVPKTPYTGDNGGVNTLPIILIGSGISVLILTVSDCIKNSKKKNRKD